MLCYWFSLPATQRHCQLVSLCALLLKENKFLIFNYIFCGFLSNKSAKSCQVSTNIDDFIRHGKTESVKTLGIETWNRLLFISLIGIWFMITCGTQCLSK
ncbi:hypothetical protein WN943_028958 [Citrus x changshan-huyou]